MPADPGDDHHHLDTPSPPGMEADEVASLLGLVPLPDEGGRWAQTHLDDRSSGIHFLLSPGDFSAMHRLPGVELYHFHAGDPAELTLLRADGSWTTIVLGVDLRAGQRPTVVVPGGTWQGSRTLGAWSLLGTTMAPPFSSDELEIGRADALRADYPGARDAIGRLTR